MKKRSIALVLTVLLLFGTALPSMAYSTVRYGSRGNDVRTMQTMLNTVINAGLSVDGSFGPATLAAVKNYQSSAGDLAVDGVCGPLTWAELEEDYNNTTSGTQAPAPVSHSQLSSGSSGNEVRTLQTYLNTLIGAGLAVDGMYGPATQAAVKKYQSSRGLSADGICGPKTWAKLDEEVAPGVRSTLSIGAGRYAPGNLNFGSSYSINGTIASNYTITSVTVGIYYEDGSETSFVRTVHPNAYCYNIYGVDREIKFGSLAAGNYIFKVAASDASGESKTLVEQGFSVTCGDANVAGNENYAAMANATYEVQGSKMCILTSFSMLVKHKLYCEGKDYGWMTQNVIKNDYNKGRINAYWATIFSNINERAGTNGAITSRGKLGSSAETIAYLKSLLASRPEGVLVYFYAKNGGSVNQHAVVLCNYNTDTGKFMVSDPGNGNFKYVTLEESRIGNGSYPLFGRTYEDIFSHVDTIAYFN